MQQFNINKNSTLPCLEIELIQDGRTDYRKVYYAIQNADAYFTMTNIDNGIRIISNAKCDIIAYSEGCKNKFKIRYGWKKNDTRVSGRYVGQFKIIFYNDLTSDEYEFQKGELIVPIGEELIININDSIIKTF